MKKFYFAGCSITHGQDLTDIQKKTTSYPALVSKHHGVEFDNDAVPAGTNQYTISRVLQNINRYDKIYIQLTSPDRFTLRDPNTWHDVHFNRQLASTYHQRLDYYLTFGKYYYGFWSSTLFEFKNFLEQIVLLQAVLNQKNQLYLMWFGRSSLWSKLICDKKDFINNLSTLIDITNFDDHQILQQYSEIQCLHDQINLKNFMSPFDFDAEQIMHQFPVGPTGHPLEQGHGCIADAILKFEQTM